MEAVTKKVSKAAERKALLAKYASATRAAEKAAHEALVKASPAPIVVTGGVPGEEPKSWYVSEGACGFAWITVKPGTSSFARWLVKNKGARAAYYGGVEIWVHEGGQSVDRKTAYARAYAKTLTEAGLPATYGSRLD